MVVELHLHVHGIRVWHFGSKDRLVDNVCKITKYAVCELACSNRNLSRSILNVFHINGEYSHMRHAEGP